ncbi:MAG: multicopper oxidase family protein [Candidatus Diapherotrites archaeon]|nr:multicopper oxidase family protein [Candidatus Diapherotrites archaeon]
MAGFDGRTVIGLALVAVIVFGAAFYIGTSGNSGMRSETRPAGSAAGQTGAAFPSGELSAGDRAMMEHCKSMPQMPGCEKFAGQEAAANGGAGANAGYSDSVAGLSAAGGTAVYDAKDGGKITLSASAVKKTVAGTEVRMLAYNGQIPGPTIRVKQGSSLEVEFINGLDSETTVHWHGVRVKNDFDGVPGVTQKPVKPGEKFVYPLEFPDEGIYWYHPHMREDYQQELGLYGNIIVEPSDEGSYNKVNREMTLALDDILMEGNGIAAFSADFATHSLMGRFGNVMLVNGSDKFEMAALKGETVRFFVTNAANARTFNLVFGGLKLKVVGADSGKYEKEFFADSVVVAPSERYVVEVLFDGEGTYNILNSTPEGKTVLGKIAVSGRQAEEDYSKEFFETMENSRVADSISGMRRYFDKPADHEIRIGVDLMGMSHGSMAMAQGTGGIEWEDEMPQMNLAMNSRIMEWQFIDVKTGKKNEGISYEWKKGDKIKLRIFNDPDSAHPMQHPIHLHGQRFLAISSDGVESENLAWKDTVLVPSGSTADILVDVSNPGKWMLHCHVPEHMESGMHTTVNVI